LFLGERITEDADVILPYEPERSKAVYHSSWLESRIATRRYETSRGGWNRYRDPLPHSLTSPKAYEYMGYNNGDFPVAEKASAEIVSLPMFPQFRLDQQERVVSGVSNFAIPGARIA
jgi:dTDP-4-amino-4,6-dideoxygalactose transaminase